MSTEPAASAFYAAEYGHLWADQMMDVTVPSRHLAELHERASALYGLMDLLRRDHTAGPGSDGPGLLNPQHSGAILTAAQMLSEQMTEALLAIGERNQVADATEVAP